MVSDHTPMNYYRAYSKNRCVHNLLALWLSAWTCCGQDQNFIKRTSCNRHTFNLLTTESDKRMHLLTRLYGIMPWQLKPEVGSPLADRLKLLKPKFELSGRFHSRVTIMSSINSGQNVIGIMFVFYMGLPYTCISYSLMPTLYVVASIV